MKDGKHSRRAFISSILAISAATISSNKTRGQESGQTISGVIRKFNGEYVNNATITIFTEQDRAFVGRKSISGDNNGEFVFQSVPSEDLVIVVEEAEDNWFNVEHVASRTNVDITLNQKLLDGPNYAAHGGRNYQIVTVWLEVNPSDHSEQVINLEITSVADAVDYIDRNEYELYYQGLDGETLRAGTLLSEGSVSVTVPEKGVEINQDDLDSVSFSDDLSAQYSSVIARKPIFDEINAPGPLEKWHPVRTGLPAVTFPQPSVSSTQFRNINSINRSDDTSALLSIGFGAFSGSIGTLTEIVDWAFGRQIQDKFSWEEQLGDPREEPNYQDPTIKDTVTLGFSVGGELEAASVVGRFPLKFSSDRKESVIIQSAWPVLGVPGGQFIWESEYILGPNILESDNPPRFRTETAQDIDGDGKYEDINGDGVVNREDKKILAKNIDNPDVRKSTYAFDFNNNGEVDYADVVALSEESE